MKHCKIYTTTDPKSNRFILRKWCEHIVDNAIVWNYVMLLFAVYGGSISHLDCSSEQYFPSAPRKSRSVMGFHGKLKNMSINVYNFE